MKPSILFGVALSFAAALVVSAADASPKEAVTAAAKKLGAQANYSWKTTTVVPESARWRPGPVEGKTGKDGVTCLRISFMDNITQAVMEGEKGAVTNPEGAWSSLAELENEEGPGRFWVGMLRGLATPAVQAAEIAADTTDLKKEGDVYSSTLTEKGAKVLMSFRRRDAAGEGPELSDAKASAKFWLKDGELLKYEYKVQGKMSFGGNNMDVDRTTTVEIKDVGTTKIEVPEEAKKKLS
jgi:hypothetical protein